MILLALHPPYADPSTTIVLDGARGEVGVVVQDDEEDADDVVAIVLKRSRVERRVWSGTDRYVERCTQCVMTGRMHKVGSVVIDRDVDRPSIYCTLFVRKNKKRPTVFNPS